MKPTAPVMRTGSMGLGPMPFDDFQQEHYQLLNPAVGLQSRMNAARDHKTVFAFSQPKMNPCQERKKIRTVARNARQPYAQARASTKNKLDSVVLWHLTLNGCRASPIGWPSALQSRCPGRRRRPAF